MASTKAKLFDRSGMKGIFARLVDDRCPLCNGEGAEMFTSFTSSSEIASIEGWCPSCSNIYIDVEALEEIKLQGRCYLLSSYLRNLPDGRRAWDEAISFVINKEKLGRLIGEVRPTSVLEQFDMELKLICEMCPEVGLPSKFDFKTDWPLIVAQSPRAALFIIQELTRAGFLTGTPNDVDSRQPIPTIKAYERFHELRSSGSQSQKAFVAMSFAPDRSHVWKQVIKPAILAAGYNPIRVDQYEHNNRIDDEILAQIRNCRFTVADFTHQKAGIYFEAGFALGLRRNVIWMCEKKEEKELHFDTRQFNHILYSDENLAEASLLLQNRIVALEGQGSYVTPDAPQPLRAAP